MSQQAPTAAAKPRPSRIRTSTGLRGRLEKGTGLASCHVLAGFACL